ncbi:hypothetical protein JNE43_08955 [Kocuria rhizophila]|uniref:hypothetical protein n=1 Tax=Kocuria rhizophila TaxID=72000 RepID=UPI001D1ABBE0|nr:hypothetical protein [Kocuria rhizophila]MCC5674933.1 hypothetical protein [Kocuria rhizophila]
MSDREPSQDPFERIIRANTWDDVPRDDEDMEPWAEDFEWDAAQQPPQEIPRKLAEDDGDAAYDPDPGPVTSGISPGMLRALSAVLAVLVVMLGLAALPGRLPAPVWAAGIAALVGALFLVFRALPRDSPRDDDGAVL